MLLRLWRPMHQSACWRARRREGSYREAAAAKGILESRAMDMVVFNMRLRGAPSLPDENLASSRARRSTAFSGSFTEPVRESPYLPFSCRTNNQLRLSPQP